MMTSARICERWTLELEDPPPASAHLTNSWLAFASLASVYGPEDIESVFEGFPGVGAWSLMIEELFDPLVHVVGEALVPANLIALDFPDFAAIQATGARRTVLDAVFGQAPKAVVLTESGGPALAHLQGHYDRAFHPGAARTYPAALTALTDLLRAAYGYQLCRGYFSPDAAVLALVPQDLVVPGTLHPTPASPVGLKLF